MKISVWWTTHNRKYTIDAVEFLKHAGIVVSDEQLVATAKKLLEQQELEEDNPPH